MVTSELKKFRNRFEAIEHFIEKYSVGITDINESLGLPYIQQKIAAAIQKFSGVISRAAL